MRGWAQSQLCPKLSSCIIKCVTERLALLVDGRPGLDVVLKQKSGENGSEKKGNSRSKLVASGCG
jgi:hypothetical protein